MAKRERKNKLKIFLSDDEQYILEQKVKISGMKSKSAFLRCLILYGFVYDLDYSDLRDYNATLGKISGNLNQIAKRMNAYSFHSFLVFLQKHRKGASVFIR